MVIASDILLRGNAWQEAVAGLSSIFTQRLRYEIFLLATCIGIAYDQKIERLPGDDDSPPSVPRLVFNNNSEPFDELFQTAILTTTTEDISDEKRLELAFGDTDKEFNRIAFLLQFANFGVTKIVELLANDEVETAESIKEFLLSTVEGTNLDIESLDGLVDDNLDV